GMGVVLLPVLFTALVRWQQQGYALAAPGEPRPGAVAIVALHLALVFGAALTLAVAVHGLIANLGTVAGVAAGLALVAAALAPGGPVHRIARALGFAQVTRKEQGSGAFQPA
ncbi:MAG TPA: hypothetical protein VGJ32_06310, partial [Solirubrobacteraceae bacterium]